MISHILNDWNDPLSRGRFPPLGLRRLLQGSAAGGALGVGWPYGCRRWTVAMRSCRREYEWNICVLIHVYMSVYIYIHIYIYICICIYIYIWDMIYTFHLWDLPRIPQCFPFSPQETMKPPPAPPAPVLRATDFTKHQKSIGGSGGVWRGKFHGWKTWDLCGIW